jgi:photosystem II biogenesis protein Psp29
VNNVRTVSDTKRAFYAHHTRPINSIYRRVVEELMVEMHLLSVNVDFRYDPIYALGVVTSFDRFMQGYRPEQDKPSIFNAICQSVEGNPDQYRQDAESLKSQVAGFSLDDWKRQLPGSESFNSGPVADLLRSIAENPKFKYSRLFAIGIYSLLEQIDPEMLKDDKQRDAVLQQTSTALKLPDDKIQKDLELYRSNLDKMTQAQIVMEDILKADRKKREERAKAAEEAAASAGSSDGGESN